MSRGPNPTGRIVIPRIHVDLATFEGIDDAALNQGPTHWEITTAPGEVGNTTFAGHRVTHTRPFIDIDLIRAGDEVIFSNAFGRFAYEATKHFVVDERDTWIADPTDTATFTLFSCHPKHSYKQRYVVQGKLVRADCCR